MRIAIAGAIGASEGVAMCQGLGGGRGERQFGFPSRRQILPSPAESRQRKSEKIKEKSLDFLGRIGPLQWVTLTPWAFFLFAASSGQ
jgi:hypothetical protein